MTKNFNRNIDWMIGKKDTKDELLKSAEEYLQTLGSTLFKLRSFNMSEETKSSKMIHESEQSTKLTTNINAKLGNKKRKLSRKK